jgi:hypothetical protein
MIVYQGKDGLDGPPGKTGAKVSLWPLGSTGKCLVAIQAVRLLRKK